MLELGRAVDPAKLGLPGSVFARARVPRQQVLQSAHVFITHADAASVNDGAAAGVPMIAIPRGDDQFFNARLIAGRGIGMTLAADGLTHDALREAVDAVCDQASTVSTCQHIRDSFTQLGGLVEALAVLRRAADPLDHVAGEQAASGRALRVGAENQTMTITDGRHRAAKAD